MQHVKRALLLALTLVPIAGLAHRVTPDDLGETGPAGGSALMAWIGVVLVAFFLIRALATDKGFRQGFFTYVAYLAGMGMILKFWGTDALLWACGISVVILVAADPSWRQKK